ncbi:MAG TPA: glycosyltransferase 61 family protein, partial [Azospirillaceae bacterium]|nr:glycosyltransferase 61 family protein [Azospirillaceae bacterium]
LAPGNAGATCALAEILEELGEAGAALAPLEAALRHQPGSGAAHLALAHAHWRLGREEEAGDRLRRGVAAAPDDVALREAYLSHCTRRAAQAVDGGQDPGPWCRAALEGAAGLPRLTGLLYERFEILIRLSLLGGHDGLAAALLAVRSRFDFPGVAAGETDIFPVSLHDFPDWCAASGLRAEVWTAAAQPVPAAVLQDLPDYLRPYAEALSSPAAARVGVALEAEVEVVQGFYVKDNYESFVLAGRRHLLQEETELVVAGPAVPLVGVTRGCGTALFRLPRPLYRPVEVAEPCLFLPSTPNYWHFLVDILPRLLVRDRVPGLADLPVALFDLRGFHYEMLELAGVPREQIADMRARVEPGEVRVLYRFRRAAMPSSVPYPVAYRWLRETFLPRVRGTPGPSRVYLSRRGAAPKHRIANDAGVASLLAGYGFETVQPERLGVLETVELVAGAEIVVAPIGAGTANHVFMPPGCTWVHLANPDFFHAGSNWNRQMGTQSSLVGRSRRLTGRFPADPSSLPADPLDRLDVPVEIDLAALDRLVRDILAGA